MGCHRVRPDRLRQGHAGPSDGEQRRDNFYSFVVEKLQGMKLMSVAELLDFVKDRANFEETLRALDVPAFAMKSPVAVGPIRPRKGLARDEADFLRTHTNRKTKVPLPGPYMLTRSSWFPGLSDETYPSIEDLGREVSAILRAELLALKEAGVNIRRAQPFEISSVRRFIENDFSVAWADEISVGFANKPVTVYIATSEGRVVGFAGYECTRKSFFGPTGVSEDERGHGIGKALLIASLWGLRELGYVYGIIGGAGPVEFYRDTVRAMVIPETEPGIYVDLLK